MLNSMNLPGKFKKVLQDISGSTGLELLDNSLFQDTKEILGTNKSSAVQECRCFTETPISSRKCCAVICKVLYLLTQGETFTPKEKSDIFFACTRLFQSPSTHLRRMVHLLIKTLHPSADEAFVVTSSLQKDIASSDDLFRANAFRTLVRIIEPQHAMQLERFLKAAIVDRNPHVASTALLCSIHLCKSTPELVRRWVNEVSGCVSSKHPMVQFHALALLDELKRSDRLALHRVIASLTAKVTKSPMAECLLIRYATRLLAQPGDSPLDGSLLAFLEGSLQHRSEIVSFEAARSFVQLALHSPKFSSETPASGFDFTAAITSLQILLTNPKPVIRFAAIRTLYIVSQSNPQVVSKCHVDIEPLITDTCRAVSVLALITLLKTGRDQQIEKLIKQVSSIMVDISESQTIEIVTALRSLCLSYPSKVKLVVQFLATQLREEGGVMAKTHAVNTLCFLAREMPIVHEYILLQLCDFIEDCEYQVLCCHVLSFLTVEIPKTEQPAKFLRYLYNRVILENAIIRAAAVDALVRVGMQCPAVSEDVITVLNTSLVTDAEDEVRERVRVSIRLLRKTATDASTVADSDEEFNEVDEFDSLMGQHLVKEETALEFSLDALVHSLSSHIAEKRANEFDISILPDEETYQAKRARQLAELEEVERAQVLANAGEQHVQPAAPSVATGIDYEAEVRALAGPEIDLGRLHHHTEAVYLTECEAEYVVQYVKHIWENAKYISLEVHIKNTLEQQTLENVELRLAQTYDSSKFQFLRQTRIETLPFETEKVLFVLIQRMPQAGAATLTVPAQLSYTMKEENDPIGFDDVYEMEPVSISPADYLSPSRLSGADFVKFWSSIGAEQEVSVKMLFGHMRGGKACAVDRLVSLFNLHKCDIKTDENKRNAAESIYLAGKSALSADVLLIHATIVDSPQHGILGKVQLRCVESGLASAVAEMIRNS